MKNKSLVLRFVSDISKASRDIDRLTAKIDKLNMKSGMRPSGTGGFGGGIPGIGQASSGLNNLSSSTLGVITKFGLLASAVLSVIGAIKHVVNQVTYFGNLVEGAKIQLTQFTNEKQAMADIRGARRFSLLTPFGPAEVLGATASARQFGIDPYGKNKYGLSGNKTAMDIIGGLASFRNPMTGEAIGMNRAAYAVAGGDTRLLRPFGVDVRQAYESAKGAGPLRSAAFIEKFITELGKMPKVLNMAEAQSNSIAGLWSTIAGFAEEFWMDLTGAGEETGVVTMWSQLRDILKDVRDGGLVFMNYISPYVTEFGTYIGATFKYVWELLKLIWNVVGPVLVPAFKIIIQLFRVAWEIGKGFMTTFIQLGKILFEIGSIPIRILNTIFGIDSKVESITQKLMKFVLGLQITFMFVQIFLDGVIQSISRGVDYIISKFQDFILLFTEFYKKYEPYINAIAKGIAMSTPLSGMVPATELSGNIRSNVRMERSLRNSENIEANRAGITVKSGDTIINNYETQKVDIEAVKNMSGKFNFNPFRK